MVGQGLVVVDYFGAGATQDLGQGIMLAPGYFQVGLAGVVPQVGVRHNKGRVGLFKQHPAQRFDHALAVVSVVHEPSAVDLEPTMDC
jgi:hypothetical protein